MIRILFVDSGLGGIAERYAYDVHSALLRGYQCRVRRISPSQLNRRLLDEFNPQVLLVIHGTLAPTATIDYANSRGITTVLWLVEDPYEIDFHRGTMVEPYQYVFTNERQAVGEYDRPNVFYLPWCCNPRVHRKVAPPPEYRSDVCFVGMGFPNRLRIMNDLAERLPGLKYRLIGEWEKWGRLHPALRSAVLPTVANIWEVRRFYGGALINLNIHRDPTDPPSGNAFGVGATSPNDRAFALAGCGAFQLVDDSRPDLWDCFVPGKEIVCFHSPEDLAEKIRHYLTSPERGLIAQSAQIRAYREHTVDWRLETIFRAIKKPLPVRAARDDYQGSAAVFRDVSSGWLSWRFRG